MFYVLAMFSVFPVLTSSTCILCISYSSVAVYLLITTTGKAAEMLVMMTGGERKDGVVETMLDLVITTACLVILILITVAFLIHLREGVSMSEKVCLPTPITITVRLLTVW